MKLIQNLFVASLILITCSCAGNLQEPEGPRRIPSLDYARTVRTDLGYDRGAQGPGMASGVSSHSGFQSPQAAPGAGTVQYGRNQNHGAGMNAGVEDSRARLRYVKDYPPEERAFMENNYGRNGGIETNMPNEFPGDPDVEVYRSNRDPYTRDYNGPLGLGDPGVTASLWRQSNRGNDIFRDHRAFQPMDLLTIVVAEDAEGSKEADTEVKGESDITLGIANLLGFENDLVEKNPGIDPANLVNASSVNDYKGEGETTRKGFLTAKISAMVVEVLPSGVLRVEGEKIISVNNEEQVMVISGLVRTRDISSVNEVDSSKVANMRIDYYGRGIVGDAQYGGWLSRIFRVFWPF